VVVPENLHGQERAGSVGNANGTRGAKRSSVQNTAWRVIGEAEDNVGETFIAEGGAFASTVANQVTLGNNVGVGTRRRYKDSRVNVRVPNSRNLRTICQRGRMNEYARRGAGKEVASR